MSEEQGAIPQSQEKKLSFQKFLPWMLIVLIGGISAGVVLQFRKGAQASATVTQIQEDTLVTVKLAFVGDLMGHMPLVNESRTGQDSFDFSPSFRYIQQALSSADWSFGNLELVCAGSQVPYHGYPRFNTPDDYLPSMKKVGFDFLSTVNNHSLDQGWPGLERTCHLLDSLGMARTGTFLTPQDRDSIRIVNLNGMKMAVVGFTFGTNGMPIPKDKNWCINLIDSTLIFQDISAAKRRADVVMAYFHWGNEYERVPNAYQKKAAEWTIAAGADFIIGCHPHVLQPVEYFKTSSARMDSGIIAWSLGNFYSNQTERYADAGVILFMELTRNTLSGKIWISDLSCLPTWMYRAYHPAEHQHYIFPSETGTRDSFPSFFTPECRQKIVQAHQDNLKKMAEGNGGRMRILSGPEFR